MASLSTATRHERVRANGLEFHVALAGRETAPLLLCLHGFPECWYSWRHQLSTLSDRFLVAAPDLRGYGETEKPPSGYQIRNLAADIAGLVRALGRERAHIVGHDWGGLVAYTTAALFRDVAERLVVLNCPHPAAIYGTFTLDQLLKSWYIFAIQIPWFFDWRLARNDAAIIPRIFLSGATRRSMFRPEDLDELRRSFARPGVVPAALAYYRTNLSLLAMLRGAMRIPPVAAPTLVIYGRNDPFVGPSFFRDHARHFLGSYEFREIPDCGHWTQQEAPELVNEAIAGFLAS
jgi:pimeloyl-ACP methyl ester carboxylesterase